MKVREAMTPDVHVARPEDTIHEAARAMAQLDVGALPVGDDSRLLGMITDRDIAIRAVALGRGPETPVQDVMSAEVMYCFADQEVDEVSRNMGDIKVRRLPVVDADKRLVGILSLGDVATRAGGDGSGEALREISTPGGQHSQTGPGLG